MSGKPKLEMNLLRTQRWVSAPRFQEPDINFRPSLVSFLQLFLRGQKQQDKLGALETGVQDPAPGPLQQLMPQPRRISAWLLLAFSSQLKNQLIKWFPSHLIYLPLAATLPSPLSRTSHALFHSFVALVTINVFLLIWLPIYHVSPCVGRLH